MPALCDVYGGCGRSKHPQSSSMFVSSARDRLVVLWDAVSGKAVKSISTEHTPMAVDWNPFRESEIAVITSEKYSSDKAKSAFPLSVMLSVP